MENTKQIKNNDSVITGQHNNSFEKFMEVSIPSAVLKNAIPAIAAMLLVLVYNLADTFFIGQTHDALQVAAVSLATPIFMIFMSIGIIFGIGGTSVISRAKGQGRTEYANKVSAFCMWGALFTGIVISAIFYFFMDTLLTWVGASPDTWELAKSYLSIVTGCGPLVILGNCFSNILRAEGKPTKAMKGMMFGNLANIILDPILILGFGWNIVGAAIATVIGNVIGAGYYLLHFIRGKSSLSISLKDFTIKDNVCVSVLSIGIPACLGSLLMSISQIVVNSLLSGYGDMAVAAIGVAMKVTMIISMISIGLGQGIQPLLGYCIGAKNWLRYKGILRYALILSFCIGVIMTGLCLLFTNQIVSVFLTEPAAYSYAVQFARILLSTSFLFGIFFCLINALQAMGAAIPSLIVNISRQGLLYIPALFILRAIFGINGLVIAQPIVDILSLILALTLYKIEIKKIQKRAIVQSGITSEEKNNDLYNDVIDGVVQESRT